jgi:YbbR domain-containing protein
MAVALIFACIVWYSTALVRRERISERQLDAAVTFVNIAGDMAITSEVPPGLTLRVRGPLSSLRSLSPADVGVVIDLRDEGEGEHDVAVETRQVVVPGGVEVLAVSPSRVPLRLERIIRRRLTVQPPLSGTPAAGMVVGRIFTEPAKVLVSGPRLLLDTLPAVGTDPVVVTGATSTVESVVAVHSPHPLVRIVEPLTVRAAVTIVPERESPAGGGER